MSEIQIGSLRHVNQGVVMALIVAPFLFADGLRRNAKIYALRSL
jgi:hypothetical protein